MEKEIFLDFASRFLKAVKEKTLLVIIDSSSRGEGNAHFSLVSFHHKHDASQGYTDFAPLLRELGFRAVGKSPYTSRFSHACAGRYDLFILDAIGHRLRAAGVKLPKDYFHIIQHNNVIA